MATTPPLIGITCGRIESSSGEPYVGQRSNYAEAIQRAGGLPVFVPPCDAGTAVRVLERLDGLFLPGGADVDPVFYGEAAAPECGRPDAALDALEIGLVRAAVDRQVPLLGVCRGQQAINVALGGSLYQDIASQYATTIEHRTPRAKGGDFVAHGIRVEPASRLAQVLGRTDVPVNSSHHQAVKEVAGGLAVVATSPDGIVEGMESADGLILTLQCHPERMLEEEWSQRFFRHFVELAGSRG